MFHTSKAGSYCIQNISITTVYAFLSPFITTSLKCPNRQHLLHVCWSNEKSHRLAFSWRCAQSSVCILSVDCETISVLCSASPDYGSTASHLWPVLPAWGGTTELFRKKKKRTGWLQFRSLRSGTNQKLGGSIPGRCCPFCKVGNKLGVPPH